MAIKKKAKKKAAPRRKQSDLALLGELFERQTRALERIADYLQPALTVAEYKFTEVHGGTGVSPTELAAVTGDTGAAMAVAAVDHKPVVAVYNGPSDAELLS